MIQEKASQRKKILILDRNLDIFTKEEIAEGLIRKLQDKFPERFIILPVANKRHLDAVCKSPEEKILFIYGRDDSNEFTKEQINYTIESSAYVHSLKMNPIESITEYTERISEIIIKYKI